MQQAAQKKTKVLQLFVKGLPKSWTHEDLSKAFEECGPVSSAKVSINADFTSRCYGFLQMATEEALQKALAMDGREIEGCKLSVNEFVTKLDRTGTTKPRCSPNLYVKNFPSQDFTEQQLAETFSAFGSLTNVCIMRDSEGVSKQFGFTCFASSDDAQKALDHFKSADKENKGLVVCEFKTKEQRRMELEKTSYQFKKSMQLMNLIVRNVDPECSKEEFTDFFSNFGEVRSVKLIPDHQIGFVCFMDREAARMAKENANLVLRNRRLDANFCEPKESRQKRQEELWDRRVFDKQKASQY